MSGEQELFPDFTSTPVDVNIVESRAVRDRLVDRVEVLDRVKTLPTVPDGVHFITELVAGYFKVHPDAIEACVRDNRAELESNGYRNLRGAELSAFKAEASWVSKFTSQLGLFNRRAVLNVGMLLRDSEVAKRVRAMLLDTEAQTNKVATLDVTSLDGVEQLLLAAQKSLEIAKAERQRAELAEARADDAEDILRQMRAAGGLNLRVFRKTHFPDVGERVFLAHCYRQGYLIDQRPCWPDGERKRDSDGNLVYGPQHNHPGHAGLAWLKLEGTDVYGGKRRAETRVRPHTELDFVARLVQDGLPRHDQPQIGAAS